MLLTVVVKRSSCLARNIILFVIDNGKSEIQQVHLRREGLIVLRAMFRIFVENLIVAYEA